MKHCFSEHSLCSRAVVKNEWSHSPTPRISTTLQFPFRALHYRQLSHRCQYYGVLGCDALRFGKFFPSFWRNMLYAYSRRKFKCPGERNGSDNMYGRIEEVPEPSGNQLELDTPTAPMNCVTILMYETAQCGIF
jgi:hypothetical protein